MLFPKKCILAPLCPNSPADLAASLPGEPELQVGPSAHNIRQNYTLREFVLILPNQSPDGSLCFLPSQVMIEPGRSLVATAGLLLTRVIGR